MKTDDTALAIFCAAITGHLAAHAGDTIPLPHPDHVVNYARAIVRAAFNNDEKRFIPNLIYHVGEPTVEIEDRK